MNLIDRRISVAPMMDCTDRHDRYFLRLIAPHALLYSEMVTTGALIYGDTDRFLQFHPLEHPIALQLGGSQPEALAKCAKMGEDYQYDEVNLNVGCPSDRVKSGRFGACLMLDPPLVAECIAAMREAVSIPVTVKCRIGVDEQDSYEQLTHFIQTIAATGCDIFVIHARKAWLNGLSPRENREIPPLRYDVVYQLKQDFPQLTFVINGGIKTVPEIQSHLQHVDGVMIGREAYSNPYLLADIEKTIYPESYINQSRQQIIQNLIPYVESQLQNKVKLSNITRHILGIFQGQPGARQWRRHLSENAFLPGATAQVINQALSFVNHCQLDI